MDKICVDCRHFETYGTNNGYTRCRHPKNASRLPSRNLVTGEEIAGMYVDPPHILRSYDWIMARMNGACGAEGRFFVPIVNQDF